MALFHAVGLTPEAPTLAAALHHRPPDQVITLADADLLAARRALNTLPPGAPLTAVSVGTPHFSRAEFARLGADAGEITVEVTKVDGLFINFHFLVK